MKGHGREGTDEVTTIRPTTLRQFGAAVTSSVLSMPQGMVWQRRRFSQVLTISNDVAILLKHKVYKIAENACNSPTCQKSNRVRGGNRTAPRFRYSQIKKPATIACTPAKGTTHQLSCAATGIARIAIHKPHIQIVTLNATAYKSPTNIASRLLTMIPTKMQIRRSPAKRQARLRANR